MSYHHKADSVLHQVYTVDARNHGDSPHTEDHSYPLLAEDILLFMQQHSIPTATLMGHSMGGRAVMATALMEVSCVLLAPLSVMEGVQAYFSAISLSFWYLFPHIVLLRLRST